MFLNPDLLILDPPKPLLRPIFLNGLLYFNLLIFSGFTKELSSDSRLLEYPLLDCCILAKAINAPNVTSLSTFNPG